MMAIVGFPVFSVYLVRRGFFSVLQVHTLHASSGYPECFCHASSLGYPEYPCGATAQRASTFFHFGESAFGFQRCSTGAVLSLPGEDVSTGIQ